MCMKFCWPLRELLRAFLPFPADLLDPNFIVRGHSYVNLLDVGDAAIGFGCIDSLSHTYTHKGKRKRYFFRYTDEEVGHKGVLILIPTHEIMRFPQIFSQDKSRWLCCDREREGEGGKLFLLEFVVPENPITSMNRSNVQRPPLTMRGPGDHYRRK